VPAATLRAGGRSEPCAKQKAFGTVLAAAPSPEGSGAPKKPHGHLGGFFGAPMERRERRGGKGISFGLFFRGSILLENGRIQHRRDHPGINPGGEDPLAGRAECPLVSFSRGCEI